MQAGLQASPQQQQSETGARSPADQPAGTAAQAVGPPPQPEPSPSERCSSASPTHSLEGRDPQRQTEAGPAAAARTERAEQRPASAPPHAPGPGQEAGGREPALLLQLLAEEACRAGSVVTDWSQEQQQPGAGSLPHARGPALGSLGGLAVGPSAAQPAAAAPGSEVPQQALQPGSGPAGAPQLPMVLRELLAAHAWRTGLQQLGPAAAAAQPPVGARDAHMLGAAAAPEAAAPPAAGYLGSLAAPLAAQWQHGWHGPQAMQVDAAPRVQPQPGSAAAGAAAAHRHRAGHPHQAAAAAVMHGHTSSPAHHTAHSNNGGARAAAAHGHRSAHSKHTSPTAAAAAAAVAAAASHTAADSALRRAQKWQLAAKVALQSLGMPAAGDTPSPRPPIARHLSAVTSRELGMCQGSGRSDSPASPHRPAALKRSLTDLQSPRAQQLLSPHGGLQGSDAAQWILELAAGGRGSKRQALAPWEQAAEAPLPAVMPAGSGLPAAMQVEGGYMGSPPAAAPQQQAGGDCTGGTPSAGPSPAPSGDSFAFPARREPTPPTPRSATAVTAAVTDAAGVAAAAAAAAAAMAAGVGGAGASAAGAAQAGTGGSPTALAGRAKSSTEAAMQRAAMLALQAEAVHRVRREISRLLQLEMLIALMERDVQQSGSPASAGASPITPQLLPQPLAGAHMSLQPPAGTRVTPQPPGSSLPPPHPSGSTHITLQPSSSLRLVLHSLSSPQVQQAAALGTPAQLPTPASPPAAFAAASPASPASPAGAPLADELDALLAALQRAGLRPEDVGQLQKLAAHLHLSQSSPK